MSVDGYQRTDAGTGPYGFAEEPTVIETFSQSIPVHVVSTDAKPGKAIGTEFGRWRTFYVSNTVSGLSATPGAQRLLNRSLRRHRALIGVASAGPVTAAAPALASIATSGTAVQNTTGNAVQVTLAGFTATQVFVNGVLVGAGNGAYTVPAYGSLSVTFTVLGTTTWASLPQAQSSLDGVIIGAREEITSGLPAIPGYLGGYVQLGSNFRWEVQAELWVCFPQTNTGPVYVTVCDEIYASDPDAWKESQ
jgi:hypothetical protein